MGILTPRFWIQAFVSTFVTLLMIYLIKKVAGTVKIPVVSEIAEAV